MQNNATMQIGAWLPTDGANPGQDAGAMKHGRGVSVAAPFPLRWKFSCDVPGYRIGCCKQRGHSPQRPWNHPPYGEFAINVRTIASHGAEQKKGEK